MRLRERDGGAERKEKQGDTQEERATGGTDTMAHIICCFVD